MLSASLNKTFPSFLPLLPTSVAPSHNVSKYWVRISVAAPTENDWFHGVMEFTAVMVTLGSDGPVGQGMLAFHEHPISSLLHFYKQRPSWYSVT